MRSPMPFATRPSTAAGLSLAEAHDGDLGYLPASDPEQEAKERAIRLRQARELSGFATASDAARALGVPGPSYLAHENGTRGLKPGKAEYYSREFGVSTDWLLYGRGERARGTGNVSMSSGDVRAAGAMPIGARAASAPMGADGWRQPAHRSVRTPEGNTTYDAAREQGTDVRTPFSPGLTTVLPRETSDTSGYEALMQSTSFPEVGDNGQIPLVNVARTQTGQSPVWTIGESIILQSDRNIAIGPIPYGLQKRRLAAFSISTCGFPEFQSGGVFICDIDQQKPNSDPWFYIVKTPYDEVEVMLVRQSGDDTIFNLAPNNAIQVSPSEYQIIGRIIYTMGKLSRLDVDRIRGAS